jgi:hypothetical protein
MNTPEIVLSPEEHAELTGAYGRPPSASATIVEHE